MNRLIRLEKSANMQRCSISMFAKICYVVLMATLIGGCTDEGMTSEQSQELKINANDLTLSNEISQDWNAEETATQKKVFGAEEKMFKCETTLKHDIYLEESTLYGIDEPLEELTKNVQVERKENGDVRLKAASQEKYYTGEMSLYAFEKEEMIFENRLFKPGHLFEKGDIDNVMSSNGNSISVNGKINMENIQLFAIAPYDSDNSKFDAECNDFSYINYNVPSEASKQIPLKYASGDKTCITLQNVNLKMRHALTAVNFKVGEDFSDYGVKEITSITINNINMTGNKYTLPQNTDNEEGTWKEVSTGTGVAKANNLGFATKGNVNCVFATFYLLPQTLNNASITISMLNNDNKEIKITCTLNTTWQQATTKNYKIKLSTADYDGYELSVTGPSAALAYNGTSAAYSVTSYRYNRGYTQKDAASWSITKYEELDDLTQQWKDLGTTKPTWLTSLTNSGTGLAGGQAQQFKATIQAGSIIDKISTVNQQMKNATPVGSTANPYDLSTHDRYGNTTSMNTANCYVISRPGTYKIPLVYGNGIVNGATNTTAMKNAFPFCTHVDGKYISKPYIKDNGVGTPNAAGVVWSTVTLSNVSISGNYITFTVAAGNIKNGNALIACKTGSTIMWSWHLWFTTPGALQTITLPNGAKMALDNIGLEYKQWNGTPYTHPRKVRVTVTQTGSNKKATFIITQKPTTTAKYGEGAYFEWGRKDPLFRGRYSRKLWYKNPNNPSNSIGDEIAAWYKLVRNPNTWWSTYQFQDNMGTPWTASYKSVYDPCPVGFKVPRPADNTSLHSYTKNLATNYRTYVTGQQENLFISREGFIAGNGNEGQHKWGWQEGEEYSYGYRSTTKYNFIWFVPSDKVDNPNTANGAVSTGWGVRPTIY